MQLINIKTGVYILIVIALLAVFFNSCAKENDKPVPETGTMTDIDGNVYNTVKIGTKWWMAENLRVKRYRNGDSIICVLNSESDSVWSNLKTGAYCYFDDKLGYLYNFYSLSDFREITPVGWHIPSDDEWKEMEKVLGMSKEQADSLNWRGGNEGNKLKIVGGNTMYWAKSTDIYNIFGTNESGFTALGGASRIFNGQWGDLTHTGFWWTSSIKENEAWYRGLDYNKANVFRYYGPKNYGFSVRCVKD
jgi:uncharacterized protein (TIGR02145 family)